MLVVETIARIRREHFVKGKTIREIGRLCTFENSGCHSACNLDPLRRGIGVQN